MLTGHAAAGYRRRATTCQIDYSSCAAALVKRGAHGPLVEAMLGQDPASTVLGYTWIDQSATAASKLRGGQSQLRTTAAGHALAVALRVALADPRPQIHFIGHSHGAKVMTVAASLMPEPPAQVTLFDSLENLLPIVGGALSNLSWYLRALPIGTGHGATFVENYTSKPCAPTGHRTRASTLIRSPWRPRPT